MNIHYTLVTGHTLLASLWSSLTLMVLHSFFLQTTHSGWGFPGAGIGGGMVRFNHHHGYK